MNIKREIIECNPELETYHFRRNLMKNNEEKKTNEQK